MLHTVLFHVRGTSRTEIVSFTQVLGAVLPAILSVGRSSCNTVLGVCDVISVQRVV